MRVFIAILVLIFSLQSWTKADDIRDFEIEGMSIGDSALDYFSKSTLDKGKELSWYDTKIFTPIRDIMLTNSKIYESYQIVIKTGDKNYIIQTILAGIFIENLNDCLAMKKEVANYLDKVFPSIKRESGSKKHEADKKGKSIQYIDQYVLNFPTHVRVECTEFSDEMINSGMGSNSLNVVAMTDNVYKWISSGYK